MSDEVTRIAKHTSLFYIQFIATLIISGIQGVVIPRVIGAAELGLVTLTHSVYGMSTGLLDLGSSLSVTRFVAKYRAEKDESSLKTAVICTSIIKYAGSAIVGIILFFFAGYLANQVFGMPEAENLFCLMAICAFLQPIILIITKILYGYQQISRQVMLTIFLAAATAGLSIFFVLQQILVIAAGFRAVLHSFVSVVEGVGRVDISAKLRVITMVVSLILLLVLIPKFGLIGAPLAFTINAGLYLLLSTIAYTRILKLTFMYRDVAIAVMCGLIAVIVGWFAVGLIDSMVLGIIVRLILMPCIFVSLLWVTKVITKEDLRFVKLMIPGGKFMGK